MDLLRARDGTDRRMDVWRMKPSGEGLEQLTHQNAPVNFLAPIDSRTLLYVARAGGLVGTVAVGPRCREQGHAPRDRRTRAVYVRVGQPGRPARGRDRSQPHGQPVARAVGRSAASRRATCSRTRCQTKRALAPRFSGTSLFYLSLSTRGIGDGLWRIQNGQTFEVRKGADGVLSEPAATFAGRQPRGGRRQTGRKAAPRRHVG